MKPPCFFPLWTLAGVLAFVTTGSAASASARQSASGLVPPAPVTIVAPTDLLARYRNSVVRLSMTIDASGVPRQVAAVTWMPAALANRVLPAVEQWRFTPAYRDGRPVAVSVILPIKLVDRPQSALAEKRPEARVAKN